MLKENIKANAAAPTVTEVPDCSCPVQPIIDQPIPRPRTIHPVQQLPLQRHIKYKVSL